jgi:hypothetical protein
MELSGQIHAPTALNPTKEPRYPLDRGLNGSQNLSEHCGEKKNLMPMLGSRNPAVQIVVRRYAD